VESSHPWSPNSKTTNFSTRFCKIREKDTRDLKTPKSKNYETKKTRPAATRQALVQRPGKSRREESSQRTEKIDI